MPPAELPVARPSPEVHAPRWQGTAFGLELDSVFALPGLAEATAPSSDRVVRLELAAGSTLAAAWGDIPARRMSSLADADGRTVMAIDASEDGRFRLWGQDRGSFLIEDGGRLIRCAPAVEGWTWRRFLVGQVLPLAASLNGVEIMHASAVAIDGRAIAFTGPTRSGKSSVAARLVIGGARLLADDVVALTHGPEGLVAHPGLPFVVVRNHEWERMPPDDRSRLGVPIAETEKEILLAARAQRRPVALRAVYVFDDHSAASGPMRFEPVSDSRTLLANGFTSVVRSPEHLLRLLDVCSRMSTTATVTRAIVPADVDAGALAAAIRRREERAR